MLGTPGSVSQFVVWLSANTDAADGFTDDAGLESYCTAITDTGLSQQITVLQLFKVPRVLSKFCSVRLSVRKREQLIGLSICMSRSGRQMEDCVGRELVYLGRKINP